MGKPRRGTALRWETVAASVPLAMPVRCPRSACGQADSAGRAFAAERLHARAAGFAQAARETISQCGFREVLPVILRKRQRYAASSEVINMTLKPSSARRRW